MDACAYILTQAFSFVGQKGGGGRGEKAEKKSGGKRIEEKELRGVLTRRSMHAHNKCRAESCRGRRGRGQRAPMHLLHTVVALLGVGWSCHGHEVRSRTSAGLLGMMDAPMSPQDAIYVDPVALEDVPSPFESLEKASQEAQKNSSLELLAANGLSPNGAVLGVADGEDGDRPEGDSKLANSLRVNPHALRDKEIGAAAECAHECYGNGFCENGVCVCKQGHSGKHCEKGSCFSGCSSTLGRGSCNLATMRCSCKPGFAGLSCSERACPEDCNGRGYCLQEEGGGALSCFCADGWEGDACEVPACPNSCSGHGICTNRKCECETGFVGKDCGQKYCPNDCSGHGVCNEGECQCMPRWSGAACDVGTCPTNDLSLVCSGHGDCNNGVCSCDERFVGADCSGDACPMGCVYGKCTKDGKCLCDHGFRGQDCSISGCPSHCSGNGLCHGATCFCDTGFTGDDCSQLECKPGVSCSGHGKCVGSHCKCEPPYSGFDCSYKSCAHLDNCNGNGYCRAGECICHAKYGGASCAVKKCPHNCGGNAGTCSDGVCICNEGWGGEYCLERLCPGGCGHGKCVQDKNAPYCACEVGWAGPSCELLSCSPPCVENQGVCIDTKCVCKNGWDGPTCSVKTCKNECSGHGICQEDATCACSKNWDGEDCSERRCPYGNETDTQGLSCSGHGTCQQPDGKCKCEPGFTGDACQFKPCSEDCRGLCSKGKCKCLPGFSGKNCDVRTCDNDCSGHGSCSPDNMCKCEDGWSGKSCELKICPSKCSDHGQCYNGTCFCTGGFTGQACQTRICPKSCSGHGMCVDGACACREGFQGEDCATPVCPSKSMADECSGHGACILGHPHLDTKSGFDTKSNLSVIVDTATTKRAIPKCFCEDGFTGSDCSLLSCGDECSGDSVCRNGVCYCAPGKGGEHCSRTLCERDCHGHGECIDLGSCKCQDGYRGKHCEIKTCTSACSELDGGEITGVCQEDRCVCSPGYTGPDCKEKTCGVECHRGSCNGVDGQCYCESGYGGIDCSIKLVGCPNDCNRRGKCIETALEPKHCVCEKGYSGIACEVKECPVGKVYAHTKKNDSGNVVCSGNGVCAPGIGGICECNPGFFGNDCSCTHDCYNGGSCFQGVCLCAPGWRGLDCKHTTCPNDCSNRGTCDGVRCTCDVGFGGDDCSERRCPNNCNSNGLCDEGVCICNTGFGGQDCGIDVRGDIEARKCAASQTFMNSFYNFRRAQLLLLDSPNSVRLSEDAAFTTKDLDSRCDTIIDAVGADMKLTISNLLKNEAEDRAQLKIASAKPINMTAVRKGKSARRRWRSELNSVLGVCVRDIPCPHNCSRHIDKQTHLPAGGVCQSGKCVCFPGWGSEDCGERKCFKDCNNHGQCLNGLCQCDKNWEGPYCSITMDFKCHESCAKRCESVVTVDSEAGGMTPEKEACMQQCSNECQQDSSFQVAPPLESDSQRFINLQHSNRLAGRKHTLLRR